MTHTDIQKALALAPDPITALQASALQAASPIVLALAECDDDLRAEAIELFKQMNSGELDEEQRFATTALLAEILFPSTDEKGMPGLDLAEAEALAPSVDPEAKGVLDRMDREEAAFAQRLRDVMEANGVTQAELADRVGIGQPAISMMLNRACRPQRKTVVRFAQALGVRAGELWPTLEEGAVNQKEMLVQVAQILQRVAGGFGGKDHYRTITLRGGKHLSVNVLRRGHIRVHVPDVSREEATKISTAGAPLVSNLSSNVCPMCRNIPAAYPAPYQGRRGREFFGFQWHRPDGLSRADLVLIEACVGWLFQYFPLP